jgi:hypothetical protein
MTYEKGGVNAKVTPVVVGLMKTPSVQQSPVLKHICEMYIQNMHNIQNMSEFYVYAKYA